MALRLRRDVQKSSYYVWFLGADEARGLRGPRVINSVLPYIIDRAKEIDPIKVTLQVSHKGIKIVQGSSKNFIPHSAITSSIQVSDIVACVLLIYNPATKCPLHINAYRCDSDVTAEALNKQLQTLINRPENQKRFEELENRLGVGQLPLLNMDAKNIPRRQETSPKGFASSLGSDTGNSTRDSECSEEHNTSPVSLSPPTAPLKPKGSIFDSLAAELRAKLNGNGPPLLLPPRDYDTVHRSKGNLAAIELRRCRNSMIVGDMNTINGKQNDNLMPTKQVSSRGSSGIGSDLAPSPERQDVHSSSDENWSNEADNSIIKLKAKQITVEKKPLFSKSGPRSKPEDSYLRDLPSKPFKPIKESLSNPWSKEEEIRPKIMHPSDYDDKFKRIMLDEEHHNKKKSYALLDDDRKIERGRYDGHRFEEIRERFDERARMEERDRFDDRPIFEDRDRFEDKDRYNDRYKFDGRSRQKTDEVDRFADRSRQRSRDRHHFEERPRYEFEERSRNRFEERPSHKIIEENHAKFEERTRDKYEDRPRKMESRSFEKEFHKKIQLENDYKVDINRNSLKRRDDKEKQYKPYHDEEKHYPQGSMERGRKYEDKPPYPQGSMERGRKYTQRCIGKESYSRSRERNPYTEEESLPYIESMEKMMKSPIMRFKSFEEKPQPEIFQNLNSRKSQKSDGIDFNHRQRNVSESSNIDTSPPRHAKLSAKSSKGSYDRSPKTRFSDWNEDEDLVKARSRDYREQLDNHRNSREYRRDLEDITDYRKEREYHKRDRDIGLPPLNNAKSLSNLTKGYRHSYAEPLMRSGRVGLAALPY